MENRNGKGRAVVFLAWGDAFIEETRQCIQRSTGINGYPKILITDNDYSGEEDLFDDIVNTPFTLSRHLRKTELMKLLPAKYDTFLFLDSDTIVIDDISLGFEKAEKHGMAMSPAPHYSMDQFWGFDKIMNAEGIEAKGQLLYNSGVIFFHRIAEVENVFQKWYDLALKYQHDWRSDQALLSLAMELHGFIPYTLSISYNYRGFGDAISGIVRVWHSHGKLPEDINNFDAAWPPRRAIPGKVIQGSDNFFSNLISALTKSKNIWETKLFDSIYLVKKTD